MQLKPLAPYFLATLLFVSYCGWAQPTQADGTDTYIILSAHAADPSSKQPTRIGLVHRGTSGLYRNILMPHIGAGDFISKFPAGTYAIDHVDFDDKIDSESQKRYARDTQLLTFKEGKINFVGSLVFKKAGWSKFTVATGDNDELLKKACEQMPDVFESLPVVLVGTETEFFHSCRLTE